jgi:hypothetical protein
VCELLCSAYHAVLVCLPDATALPTASLRPVLVGSSKKINAVLADNNKTERRRPVARRMSAALWRLCVPCALLCCCAVLLCAGLLLT